MSANGVIVTRVRTQPTKHSRSQSVAMFPKRRGSTLATTMTKYSKRRSSNFTPPRVISTGFIGSQTHREQVPSYRNEDEDENARKKTRRLLRAQRRQSSNMNPDVDRVNWTSFSELLQLNGSVNLMTNNKLFGDKFELEFFEEQWLKNMALSSENKKSKASARRPKRPIPTFKANTIRQRGSRSLEIEPDPQSRMYYATTRNDVLRRRSYCGTACDGAEVRRLIEVRMKVKDASEVKNFTPLKHINMRSGKFDRCRTMDGAHFPGRASEVLSNLRMRKAGKTIFGAAAFRKSPLSTLQTSETNTTDKSLVPEETDEFERKEEESMAVHETPATTRTQSRENALYTEMLGFDDTWTIKEKQQAAISRALSQRVVSRAQIKNMAGTSRLENSGKKKKNNTERSSSGFERKKIVHDELYLSYKNSKKLLDYMAEEYEGPKRVDREPLKEFLDYQVGGQSNESSPIAGRSKEGSPRSLAQKSILPRMNGHSRMSKSISTQNIIKVSKPGSASALTSRVKLHKEYSGAGERRSKSRDHAHAMSADHSDAMSSAEISQTQRSIFDVSSSSRQIDRSKSSKRHSYASTSTIKTSATGNHKGRREKSMINLSQQKQPQESQTSRGAVVPLPKTYISDGSIYRNNSSANGVRGTPGGNIKIASRPWSKSKSAMAAAMEGGRLQFSTSVKSLKGANRTARKKSDAGSSVVKAAAAASKGEADGSSKHERAKSIGKTKSFHSLMQPNPVLKGIYGKNGEKDLREGLNPSLLKNAKQESC